jgi:thiamine pyrophosphokinase
VTCVICLNGEYEDEDYYLRQVDAAQAVVAADGGHAFLRRHGRWPALLIGDFDSLDASLVAEARAAGVEVVAHPARKNETDAELAVAQAEARFAGEIVLLGALGGAFDHVLGHLCILRGLAARGRAGRIAAPGLAATVLQGPAALRLGAPVGAQVSLVALSPDVVLTLRGLEYELTDEPLSPQVCRGLSNRVAAPAARVELAAGQVLVLVFDGAETFGAIERGVAGDSLPAGGAT